MSLVYYFSGTQCTNNNR